MANAIRDYFDAKVPVAPGEGRPNPGGQAPLTWRQAWVRLSRSLFETMPRQLDRTKVNRNKFIRAVD